MNPQPPADDNRERREIASQAMKFFGLIITVAGSLAILRTGQRSLLFVLMMPMGLIVWGIGMWLRPPRDDA